MRILIIWHLLFTYLVLHTAHVELPLSLLSPPAAGPSNPASSGPTQSTSTIPSSGLSKEKKKKHHLTTATDPLFAELRDLNFSSVGKRLNRVAHRLDEDYKVLPHHLDSICSCLMSFSRPGFKQRQCHKYETLWANWAGYRANISH